MKSLNSARFASSSSSSLVISFTRLWTVSVFSRVPSSRSKSSVVSWRSSGTGSDSVPRFLIPSVSVSGIERADRPDRRDRRPLTILHPGGDEELAKEVAADRVTAEWIPEGYPEAGNGERGESIDVLEDGA